MIYCNPNSKKTYTLVFMPGWGCKASIWEQFTKQFSDYRIILLELPSKMCDIPFHENSLKEVIIEIDKQLPDDSILIAWSLSGIIATHLCLSYPHKYQKLVMIASTPKFIEAPNWPGIHQVNIEKFSAEVRSHPSALMLRFQQLICGHVRNRIIRTIIQSHANHPSVFYLDMLIQSDIRELYKQLQLPVLHIFGDRDYLIPSHSAQMMQNEHPHHAVHVISGAGHIPFLTHTCELMDYLLPFLQSDCIL